MDIDSPPAALPELAHDPHYGHNHVTLPPFSASFPLPFRVLFLVGLAILLWGTNLHILHILGLDTAWILDFRETDDKAVPLEVISHEDVGDVPPPRATRIASPTNRPTSKGLYAPVYKLFLAYTTWVGGGWLVFRVITGGDTARMEEWRALVGVIMVGAAVGVVAPWQGLGWRERTALRRAVKRILVPSLTAPIFFSDVILADILTSFAKVLGDLWISACQIWFGTITQGRVSQTGLSRYLTLTMVCLPYLVRFRQCLHEFHQSSWSSPRSLYNAMKYFSAFPVILLSAAQKTVVVEVAASKGVTVQDIAASGERWFGEHRLFRLWLLAVVVNSMFSFWWDVEMDWGLALCEIDTWLPKRDANTNNGDTSDRRRPDLTLIGRTKRLFTRNPTANHQRSPHPTPNPNHFRSPSSPMFASFPVTRFFAFGLRPTLLLPDPTVYHLFAAIDLVLRFTWSLKLSTHLHTISEIESGVFMMEALELVRRWMWVFVRIEWEAVKMGQSRSNGAGQLLWEQKDGP